MKLYKRTSRKVNVLAKTSSLIKFSINFWPPIFSYCPIVKLPIVSIKFMKNYVDELWFYIVFLPTSLQFVIEIFRKWLRKWSENRNSNENYMKNLWNSKKSDLRTLTWETKAASFVDPKLWDTLRKETGKSATLSSFKKLNSWQLLL